MSHKTGFSILEIIISIGIFGLILVGIVALQTSIFRGNKISESRTNVDQRSLIVLRNFASRLRVAQTNYDGSFPIASSTDDTISFYADINGDNAIERVRYFVASGELKEGIITPSGEPLTHNPADETVTTLLRNVIANPPYFTYYGSSFDGSTSSPALIQPVSPSEVRLVEMHLTIDIKAPDQAPRTLKTRAMIRSLKNK